MTNVRIEIQIQNEAVVYREMRVIIYFYPKNNCNLK